MHSTAFLEADHEIDAQSIYGCEQMPMMRRPTQTQLAITDERDDEEEDGDNNEMAVKNQNGSTNDHFKDCVGNVSNGAFARSISLVLNRPPVAVQSEHQPEHEPKIRRWFETGSLESVHLGSSEYIFAEKNRDHLPLKGIAEQETLDDVDNNDGSNQMEIK